MIRGKVSSIGCNPEGVEYQSFTFMFNPSGVVTCFADPLPGLQSGAIHIQSLRDFEGGLASIKIRAWPREIEMVETDHLNHLNHLNLSQPPQPFKFMKSYFKINLICAALLLPVAMQAQLHIEGLLYVDAGAEVHVWNDLEIATANGQLVNNGLIEVEGNWSKDSDASFGGADGQKVVFKNNDYNTSGNQRIAGDMTGANAFDNLEIDNTGTEGIVDMDSDVEVKGNLSFVNGKLRTDTESHGNDGAAYLNELTVSNPAANAVSGHSTSGENSRYVEGRLNRAVAGMGGVYGFPVGTAVNAESFDLTFTSPAPASSLSAFFQDGTTTPTGGVQLCDVGTSGDNPDPFTPDGIIDELTIDCVAGQWSVEASMPGNYQYDATFYASDGLLANCPDALYFFLGKDGQLEDCPDMTGGAGISRSGLTGFSDFDIATASEASTDLISLVVIPTDDKRVSLFPNPVSNAPLSLSIEGNVFGQGGVSLEVFNAFGKLVFREEATLSGQSDVLQIDASDWQSGIYEMVLRNGETLLARPFIVIGN